MASSLNKVMLIGNLGADPIIRQTQDGKKLAQFSKEMSSICGAVSKKHVILSFKKRKKKKNNLMQIKKH